MYKFKSILFNSVNQVIEDDNDDDFASSPLEVVNNSSPQWKAKSKPKPIINIDTLLIKYVCV